MNILTMLKSTPDRRSLMRFRHRDFFEEANSKKALDRFIADYRPWIRFRHRKAKVCFRMNNLRKVPTLINTHELGHRSSTPRVFTRLENRTI
jgi:hypothetical protein